MMFWGNMMGSPSWIWVISYVLIWLGVGVLVFWGISKIKDQKDRLFAIIAAGLILGSIIIMGLFSMYTFVNWNWMGHHRFENECCEDE